MNADTLTNKMSELNLLVREQTPDNIGVNEVLPKNFNSQIYLEEFTLNNYEIVAHTSISANKGRGTILYIRKGINYKQIDVQYKGHEFQESVYVEISLADNNTLLCACTVYPKKYAHGFCFAVLCCGYTWTDFPISIRLTSLALWQSNDCPSASKANLMNMDKYFMWIHYERLHNHNKAKHNKIVCIFLGIYYMYRRGETHEKKLDPPQYLNWTVIQTVLTLTYNGRFSF